MHFSISFRLTRRLIAVLFLCFCIKRGSFVVYVRANLELSQVQHVRRNSTLLFLFLHFLGLLTKRLNWLKQSILIGGSFGSLVDGRWIINATTVHLGAFVRQSRHHIYQHCRSFLSANYKLRTARFELLQYMLNNFLIFVHNHIQVLWLPKSKMMCL